MTDENGATIPDSAVHFRVASVETNPLPVGGPNERIHLRLTSEKDQRSQIFMLSEAWYAEIRGAVEEGIRNQAVYWVDVSDPPATDWIAKLDDNMLDRAMKAIRNKQIVTRNSA